MNRTVFLLLNLLPSLLLVQTATAAEFNFNESWDRVAALADSAQYEAANRVVVEILGKAGGSSYKSCFSGGNCA